jgi:hypothetical protein
MGVLLQNTDEYTHTIGTASNWNESRYIDFWDARARVEGNAQHPGHWPIEFQTRIRSVPIRAHGIIIRS